MFPKLTWLPVAVLTLPWEIKLTLQLPRKFFPCAPLWICLPTLAGFVVVQLFLARLLLLLLRKVLPSTRGTCPILASKLFAKPKERRFGAFFVSIYFSLFMKNPPIPNELNPKVFWVGAFFWASSYLIPFYLLPQTMFAAMWLAVMAWGLVLCSGAPQESNAAEDALSRKEKKTWPLVFGLFGFSLLLIYIHRSPLNTSVLLVAAAVFLFGLHCKNPAWLKFLLASLVLAATVSVGLALVQLCYPYSDFILVAPVATATRATANLRQPNLFAQLLLLSTIGWMFLQGRAGLSGTVWRVSIAFLIGCGLAFSQSRTGFLGALVLLAWAVLDKGLPKNARQIPLAMALGCVAALAVMFMMAHASGALTHLEVQQRAGGDVSASRFGIWKNTLSLIAQFPWTGVGWDHFGQAWALTPFPGRPPSAFDNAHNLPLHLMVELGIPLALLLMGLFGWALWRARYGLSYLQGGGQTFEARCLLMLLAMLGLHSLLEYPLWYTFFLLPASFFLGQYLQFGNQARSKSRKLTADREYVQSPMVSALLQGAGVMIVLGSLYAVWDYARVLQVFNPFAAGLVQPLEKRIEEARKSVLFGYWADYAVVTNAENFKGLDAQIKHSFNSRMNPHMLLVYAQYLAERGELDKASYVADRLREFNNPVAKEFFAECEDPSKRDTAFQCHHPTGTYSFKDFP